MAVLIGLSKKNRMKLEQVGQSLFGWTPVKERPNWIKVTAEELVKLRAHKLHDREQPEKVIIRLLKETPSGQD